MRGWTALLPAVALLLAGCAGGSDDGKASGGDPTIAAPDSTVGTSEQGKGNVRGSVVDDEQLPLEGVTIGLLATTGAIPRVAGTDESGAFAFLGVDPGTYTLTAQKFGFRDKTVRSVQVLPGETTEVLVSLLPLPSAVPWTEAFERSGIHTGYGYKLPVLGQQNYTFPLTDFSRNWYFDWETGDRPEALQGLAGEMEWANSQALAGNMILIVSVVQQSQVPELTFVSKEGPNPIREIRDQSVTQGVVSQNNGDCQADPEALNSTCHMEYYVYAGTGNTGVADLDFALTAQQEFTTAVTMFYRLDPAEDYSYFL